MGSGKEDQARGLGAESVVTRDTADLPAAVAKVAGGRLIDVVANVVVGDAFADLLSLLRPMGRYVTAGAIVGPMVRLDPGTLYLKQLELIGSTMGTHEEFASLVGAHSLRQSKAAPRAHLPALRRQASSDRLHG